MATGLKEVRLGDVGRVDELIACFFVALSAVVLHDTSDDSTLGVKHG